MIFENWIYEIKFGLARIVSYNGTDEIVQIPERINNYNVYQVNSGAFISNDYIKKVIFPKTIGKLAEDIFIACSNLEEIELSFLEDFPEYKSIVKGCFSFHKFTTDSPRIACKIERNPSYNQNIDIFCLKDFKTQIIDEKAKTAVLEGIRFRRNRVFIPDVINGYKITKFNFKLDVKKDRYEINELKLPKYLEEIPSYFMTNYPGKIKLTLNENLKEIGEYAFHCVLIENEVKIPKTVEYIRANAFVSPFFGDNSFVLAKGSKLSFIGRNAFRHSNINFNNQGVFLNDYSLAYAKISNLKLIQDSLPECVFREAVIKSIEGFDSLKTIGRCSLLRTKNETGKVYTLDLNKVSYTNESLGNSFFDTLIIGKNTVLTEGMFSNSSFSEVYFEDDFVGDTLPSELFYNCRNLKKVFLSKSIKHIGSRVFLSDSNLSYINFENIETIGEKAFSGTDLKKIKFSPLLSSLGAGAFEDSTIQYVDFSNVTLMNKIEARTFIYCKDLNTVILSDFISEIGNTAFCNCSNLVNINLDNVKIMGSSVFEFCSSLESVNISNIVEINNHTFKNCKKLSNLKTSNKLTKIGLYAFYSCENLKEFIFCENLISIGTYAFNRTNLEKVILPDSLNELGDLAFDNANVKEFSLGKNIKTLKPGKIPFSVEILNLKEVETIEQGSLCNYSNITKLVIPKSCTKIEQHSIAGLSNLNEVYLEGKLDKVPIGLFNFCKNLTEIHTDDIAAGKVLIKRVNTSINKIVPISDDVVVRTRKKKVTE